MENKLKAEQWLYVLFVLTLPFAAQINIFGAPMQLSDLLFLAAAFVWAISFAAKRENFRFSWFYLFLAAYAIAVTLSTITSVDPSQSSVKLAGKFYLLGIAILTFNIVTSIGMLKRVMLVWLLGAGIVLLFSLFGIILFYAGLRDASQNFVVHQGYGSLPPGNYPRIEGLFSYPAIFCNFLAVTWMFLLVLWSNGWLRPRGCWLFAAALFIVDALTLTPGLGGIFLVTGYFLHEKLKAESKQIFGRLAFVSGLLITVAFLFVTSVSLFSNDASGTRITQNIEPSARVHVWQTSLETFLHDPLLGRGPGMPIANVEFTDPSGDLHRLTDAHNTYLSVLAETGLLGFLTFMSIVGVATVALIRWQAETGSYKTIRLCLLLAMLDAFFYQSLTGSYEDTRHLWVLIGVIMAVAGFDKKQPISS